MIIFMSGFPQAGKSKFVSLLKDELETEFVWINPKDYLPRDFDELPDKDQSNWQISSWEVCLEQIELELDEKDENDVIILDTAAAQVEHMRPLFSLAKKRGHYVGYVFIHANFEERQSRTETDLSGFQSYYADAFKITMPHLKRLSDYFLVVKNPNDSQYINLNESAKTVARLIKDVCGR